MKKHDLALIIMGVAIAAVTIAAIVLNGTPLDNQNRAKDQQKMETISRYRSHIENYYSLQREMPKTIAEAQSALSSIQPEIEPTIEYKITGTREYELCTTFETSNIDQYKRMEIAPDPNGSIITEAHDKGFACLKYRIPQYILDKQSMPPIRELPAQPAPVN